MPYKSKRDLRTSRDAYKQDCESLIEDNYRAPLSVFFGDDATSFNYKMLADDIAAHCRQEAAAQRLAPPASANDSQEGVGNAEHPS